MKRYLFAWLVFSCLILAGCGFYHHAVLVPVCPQENWWNSIDRNPKAWMCGADEWFVKGNPNLRAMPRGDYGAPLITKRVHAARFTKIITNGDFQLRIVASVHPEEIVIHGPRNAVKAMTVRVTGDTLWIMQPKKRSPANMSYVVVRIDMDCLNKLEQWGRGSIEGLQIRGDLDLFSMGSGNIYLSGPVHVRCIRNFGRGCINIFGAETRVLDIMTKGTGTTNICGNIGIRSIIHRDRSTVNIIGANSDCLKIYADGCGKVGVNGLVNLFEVKAFDQTRVYVNKVLSGGLNVYARQNAHVGLAGTVNNAHLVADDAAYISARLLCADSAFVRACHGAHVNINARGKIFADASDNSSIYFFGNPAILTPFQHGNGTVIAMHK